MYEKMFLWTFSNNFFFRLFSYYCRNKRDFFLSLSLNGSFPPVSALQIFQFQWMLNLLNVVFNIFFRREITLADGLRFGWNQLIPIIRITLVQLCMFLSSQARWIRFPISSAQHQSYLSEIFFLKNIFKCLRNKQNIWMKLSFSVQSLRPM